MPKSKNKRKNGRAKGSRWNKMVGRRNRREQEKKEAMYNEIKRQMLG